MIVVTFAGMTLEAFFYDYAADALGDFSNTERSAAISSGAALNTPSVSQLAPAGRNSTSTYTARS
jgi:hypothetical protein